MPWCIYKCLQWKIMNEIYLKLITGQHCVRRPYRTFHARRWTTSPVTGRWCWTVSSSMGRKGTGCLPGTGSVNNLFSQNLRDMTGTDSVIISFLQFVTPMSLHQVLKSRSEKSVCIRERISKSKFFLLKIKLEICMTILSYWHIYLPPIYVHCIKAYIIIKPIWIKFKFTKLFWYIQI